MFKEICIISLNLVWSETHNNLNKNMNTPIYRIESDINLIALVLIMLIPWYSVNNITDILLKFYFTVKH